MTKQYVFVSYRVNTAGHRWYFKEKRLDGTIKETTSLKSATFFQTLPDALRANPVPRPEQQIMAVELVPLIPNVLTD